MTLDQFLGVGTTVELGSHTFSAEEIKAFARKYDPQPFHIDEQAAAHSILGGLCASGWHTAATWMKYNLRAIAATPWQGTGPAPEFGPSPGFKNMKWLKPVYAGETIVFSRTGLGHRQLASRPGWRLFSLRAEAFRDSGVKVMEFESSVFVKVNGGIVSSG